MHQFNCLYCNKVNQKEKPGIYCSGDCQRKFIRNKRVNENCASSKTTKRYLIENCGYFCSNCGISEWNNKPIMLELEHKNGNSSDNSLDNVCLLCPNCHSQTATWKNRNKGKGRFSRRARYSAGKSY
jgi:hypothetical protein